MTATDRVPSGKTTVAADLTAQARQHVMAGKHHLALPLAHQAKDWPLVADIIEADWPRLFMKHFDMLRAAYADTPAKEFRGHPAARAVREMCFPVTSPVPGRPPAELPADSETLVGLAASSEAVDTLLAGWAGMVAMRLREDWQRAKDQASRLTLVLAEAQRHHFHEVARRIPGLEIQLGITHLMAGDVPRALRHLQRAHRTANLDLLGYVARDAAGKIALVHASCGDVFQAVKWLSLSDQAELNETVMSDNIESTRGSARGLIAAAQGDVAAAAAAHADLGGTIIEEEFWALRLHALARIGLLRGDVLGMQRVVEQRERALPYARTASPYMEAFLIADEIDLHLALGAGSRANEALAATSLDHPLLDICRGRLHLYRGDAAGALNSAHKAISPPNVGDPGPRVVIEASLLAAVAHHRLGHHEDAGTHLRLASERAMACGYAVATATIPPRYLAELTANFRAEPPTVAPPFFADDITIVELTDRERTVLTRLAEGLPLNKIAEADFVSVNTVKTQARSLYRKLKASGRDEAIQHARAEGLL